jgi:hypothetical protein
MKRLSFFTAISIFTVAPAFAQVAPSFTQGSMNSTTNTEQTITETIAVEKYGGAYNNYAGHNVTPSAEIGGSSTTYSMTQGADNWQLEITTRAAGVIETQDIERTIETTSTTTSLSVFSQ